MIKTATPRQAMHFAEHIVRMLAQGARMGALNRHISNARAAYFVTQEVNVARRLHVAIDAMEGALA